MKKNSIILIFAVSSGLAVLSYFLFAQEPIPSDVQAHVRIGNQMWYCEVADTDAKRAQGLSYRKSLAENACMVFVFPDKHIPHFWMKDMHFDLDVIWVNDQQIVDITSFVPAPKKSDEPLNLYSPQAPVNIVIELNAGQAQKYGILPGQSLNIDFF